MEAYMHRLERQAVLPPTCLARYRHGRDNWRDVSAEHRTELRVTLEQLQGRRCAYCEGPLDTLGEHIEHFRRRHTFPHLTFEWENLFWSCNQDHHCGRHKDSASGPYDPEDLINPAIDDPECFFRFSSDGTIRLIHGLSPDEERRAKETLRVFKLDHENGPLRRMRELYCVAYVRIGAEIAQLASDSMDLSQQFLEDELERTRGLPFETAIKHTLTPV